MNIRYKGRRYRLTSRFFISLMIISTVLLSTVMTLDFEQRWNPPADLEVSEVVLEEDAPINLGEFRITYYCNEPYPHICNDGQWTHTSTKQPLIPYKTISVDPSIIPYGSTVYIEGDEFIATDCGDWIKGKHIDMLVDSHQKALDLGVDYETVYLKEEINK